MEVHDFFPMLAGDRGQGDTEGRGIDQHHLVIAQLFQSLEFLRVVNFGVIDPVAADQRQAGGDSLPVRPQERVSPEHAPNHDFVFRIGVLLDQLGHLFRIGVKIHVNVHDHQGAGQRDGKRGQQQGGAGNGAGANAAP